MSFLALARPMLANDFFANAAEVDADLQLLERLRWTRKEFFDRVCEASASRNEEVLATLRLEAVYQVAEFFYLLRARRIETEDQVRMLAEGHNQYIVDLTKDPAKLARMGLGRDRLLAAMLTADTLPRLVHHWAEQPGTLDQSNLARFLAALMSTETCRKVVVACGEAGFFARHKSPHGTVLVRSLGTLERVFGETLREFRHAIERSC
jgi:hypothetical protein